MDHLGLSEHCKFSLISALSCCSLGWPILSDFPWWFNPTGFTSTKTRAPQPKPETFRQSYLIPWIHHRIKFWGCDPSSWAGGAVWKRRILGSLREFRE